MRKIPTYLFMLLALLSLGVLIYPSVMYLIGKYTLPQVQWIMLMATVMWFVAAALWMGRPGTHSE